MRVGLYASWGPIGAVPDSSNDDRAGIASLRWSGGGEASAKRVPHTSEVVRWGTGELLTGGTRGSARDR
jgi:hypothetical protein